jgi:nucleotide-binding universal stress UspA family protein
MTGSGSPRDNGVWGARVAPVVAAVEPQTAPATAERAAHFARELGAPVAFVSVRPRLPTHTRRDSDEHRLSRDLLLGRKALDIALAAAARHGVMAYGEIVEGDPAPQIVEFAASRNAPVLVVGRRRETSGPSVSREVVALSARPVVVAAEKTGEARRANREN